MELFSGRITEQRIKSLSEEQKDYLSKIYPYNLKIAIFLHRNPNQRITCEYCNNKLSESQILSKRKSCSFNCAQLCQSTRTKIEQTCLERYGTKSPTENKDVLLKRDENNLKKYGVKHTRQVKEIDQKIKKTCLERYGFEVPQKNKEISEKMCSTNLERYGNRQSLHGSNQERTEQIFLKKYGFNIPTKHEQIKQKNSKKNKGRKVKDAVLERIIQTNLIRYGVKRPLQNEQIRKKFVQTNLRRYGYDFPARCKTHQEFMQSRLRDKILSGEIKFYKVSSYEDQIFDFLSNINRFEIVRNDRIQIGLELDIYIPELKLAIEVNGELLALGQ